MVGLKSKAVFVAAVVCFWLSCGAGGPHVTAHQVEADWLVQAKLRMPAANDGRYPVAETVRRGLALADDLRRAGAGVAAEVAVLEDAEGRFKFLDDDEDGLELYLEARRAVRRLALSNPLLDFDGILFVKRSPTLFPHMSDQYYGWWSRPGGGIYVLEGFKGPRPRLRCLTGGFAEGNFLRPELSYDGDKVLFAWCRYYPCIAGMEKIDKEKLPEDAFYSIFEVKIDGTGLRQLTRGRYDDFDARYLPDGDIVFLSTRKGQFLQCTKDNTASTTRETLPDSFVRCGGNDYRPVPVFTLHRMDADGGGIHPISAFENFEWTPSVAGDGRILYARWDYIDRFNGHFMSLWSANPDGTHSRLVYGNFTKSPQCIFEARAVPGSEKLIFTGSAHHSITGGSIALLDRTAGTEGPEPVTRLTGEVVFPEAEGWPKSYYANPWPLSERYFLVSWSSRPLPTHNISSGNGNPVNASGLYLCDAFGNLELIYRDPLISSTNPVPVRPRARPRARTSTVARDGPQTGVFLLQDVYRGLEGVERGSVKRLRIVGVVPKVQPLKNRPVLGVSKEEPGKFILGTVPVEEDGSAHFWVPSGVPVFFQALDEGGLAVQTMRSLTYVQPGEALSCIGCHEPRDSAPNAAAALLAAGRPPSRIKPGPEGSWPLRFDRLVQPVLDRSCAGCHSAGGGSASAAKPDLGADAAWKSLVSFAQEDLKKLAFEKDRSVAGGCPAANSRLMAMLTAPGGHRGVQLTALDLERLATWMDTYAHIRGCFSDEQEIMLAALRRRLAGILAE
jgi:hypothetical protein